jgi:hypothetical protein
MVYNRSNQSFGGLFMSDLGGQMNNLRVDIRHE